MMFLIKAIDIHGRTVELLIHENELLTIFRQLKAFGVAEVHRYDEAEETTVSHKIIALMMTGEDGEQIKFVCEDKPSDSPKTKTVCYNDQLLSRNRKKVAGFVLNGEFIPFHEGSKRKVAVIKKLRFEKRGKWSNADYEITTRSATFIMGYSPFNGWSDDMDDCIEHIVGINNEIGNVITTEEAKVFLRHAFPDVWEQVMEANILSSELL